MQYQKVCGTCLRYPRRGRFVTAAALAVQPKGVTVSDWGELENLGSQCELNCELLDVFEVVAWNVLVSELGEAWLSGFASVWEHMASHTNSSDRRTCCSQPLRCSKRRTCSSCVTYLAAWKINLAAVRAFECVMQNLSKALRSAVPDDKFEVVLQGSLAQRLPDWIRYGQILPEMIRLCQIVLERNIVYPTGIIPGSNPVVT